MRVSCFIAKFYSGMVQDIFVMIIRHTDVCTCIHRLLLIHESLIGKGVRPRNIIVAITTMSRKRKEVRGNDMHRKSERLTKKKV
jgi:hypothetical protein